MTKSAGFFGLIFSLLICSLSFAANESNRLLEYHYGNRTIASDLVIFEDGTILHVETACCPPQTIAMPEPALSVDQLKQLRNLIEVARNAGGEVFSGEMATRDSMTGSLVVSPDSKETFDIRTISIVLLDMPDLIVTTRSSEAKAILEFVKSYVKNKME